MLGAQQLGEGSVYYRDFWDIKQPGLYWFHGLGDLLVSGGTGARLLEVALVVVAGLDRTALAKIETGARRVTVLELAQIAEQTGESLEWFVTDPPAAVVSYRLGAESSTTSSIDRLIEQAARDVELLQSLGYLGVTAFDPFDQPSEATQAMNLAAKARELLELDPLEPIADLVEPLAAIGLFAFSESLGPDSPDAATTLLAQGGVSIINSDRAARTLLLPAESLSKRWGELVAHDSVREAAVRVANEYRVDMSTLATRLSELSLANQDDLSIVRGTTTTRADIIEYDLIIAYDLEGTTLPRRYAKAVLALFRSERVSAVRAVDLLRGTIDEAGLPSLPPVNENEIWKFTS